MWISHCVQNSIEFDCSCRLTPFYTVIEFKEDQGRDRTNRAKSCFCSHTDTVQMSFRGQWLYLINSMGTLEKLW